MARKPIANNETIVAKTSNQLKIRIDDLKSFSPLTDNQKIFFDSLLMGQMFLSHQF